MDTKVEIKTILEPLEKEKINLNVVKISKKNKTKHKVIALKETNNIFSYLQIRNWLEKNDVLSILDALLDSKHLDSYETMFNDSLLESKPLKDVSCKHFYSLILFYKLKKNYLFIF
jgi:hypothetical protein